MDQHIAAAALGQPQGGIAPSLDALRKGRAVGRAQPIHRRPYPELAELHRQILISLAPLYPRRAPIRQGSCPGESIRFISPWPGLARPPTPRLRLTGDDRRRSDAGWL